MHQTDPKSGELSFELLAEIAVGQTARVELCKVVEGPLEGELVAVKRLHPHIAEDPQFVDMFRDEVWMTAALKHAHVVEVVGWGQDAVGPWLAVEFVRGVSLQRLMKTVFETGERFTERMVVYLARCICDGLVEAHNLRSSTGQPLNLVHRDLTPGNILLGFDGQVKITDFGLAKAKQRLTKTLTGLLKGQPQYMSPEQVQGGGLDGRSDIFALGVVLFELFGGRRPWNAATDLDAMRAITDEPPGDLLALRPRIDKALVDVVNHCLEKDRNKRWQSAEELRERFDEWLNAHGYRSDNHVSLARFVRRNAMRQMRWFERAMAGEFAEDARAKQSMPLGRISGLPPEPVAPPPANSSARTQERTATRDERPKSLRIEQAGGGEAPPAKPTVPKRRLPAKTRLTHDTEGEEPAADSIDWGDDGPTLVQRSEEARDAIRAARKAKARQQLPTAEPTTRRQRAQAAGKASSHAPATGEAGKGRDASDQADQDIPTVPDRGERIPADGTAKIGLAESGAQRRGNLGVVAPPDPDVPPPPVRPSSPAPSSLAPSARRSSTAPASPGAAQAPPSPRPDSGPDSDEDDDTSTQRDAPAETNTGRRASNVDATGATRPLSVEEIERPKIEGLRLGASFGQEADSDMAKGLGAMPAPRFPSMPTLSGEVPSMDVSAEARRFGEAARRAADFAEAAAKAAKLSAEAALLAAEGKRHEAIARLRQAQQIEQALERGEAPPGGYDDLPDIAQGLSAGKWLDRLQSREGMMVMLVVAVGLVLAVLVLAIVV
jgi:serine/threonine-protein kinase